MREAAPQSAGASPRPPGRDVQRVSKGRLSEPPVPGAHRLAPHHGLRVRPRTPSWEHPAVGRCCLTAPPWGAGMGPQDPPEHSAQGGTQGKGCSWWGLRGCCGAGTPVMLPGGAEGPQRCPGLPEDGAFPTPQEAQSRWQRRAQAAPGAEMSSSCFPVTSGSIAQPNRSPSPSPWGPGPRQPPATEPSSPVSPRGWTGRAGGSEVLGAIGLRLCSPGNGEQQNGGT